MAAQWIERLFSQWTWRLPAGCKSVALTFDDGPHPDTTPALLAVLKQFQIPSTHFVLGSHCQENAKIIEAIHASGHALGSHGFEHLSLAFRSSSFQRQTIRQTGAAIYDILHEQPRLFRPPYGHFNHYTRAVLRQENLIGVLWSLHARDWKNQNTDMLWERIRVRLHEGAIIVLHDAHPTTAAVIQVLPRLAEEISRRGWSFVALNNRTLPTKN